MSEQKASFQARLDRMGMAERPPPPASAPRRRPAAASDTILGRLGYPLSFVAAFGLGYLLVLLLRYGRWHVLGMQGILAVQPDVAMFLDVAMASGAAWLIGRFVRMRSAAHMAAQTFGVVAAVISAHNLVWWYPQTFAAVYSWDFVETTQRMTVPDSLHFRGITFRF